MKGFSFIEIMLVIALVGILLSVSYPAYTQYVIKVRRTDAQTALHELAAQMERYFTENNTYKGATFAKLGMKNISPQGFYKLAIQTKNTHTYKLSAEPMQTDSECGTLSLDQVGKKEISGTSTIQNCW